MATFPSMPPKGAIPLTRPPLVTWVELRRDLIPPLAAFVYLLETLGSLSLRARGDVLILTFLETSTENTLD